MKEQIIKFETAVLAKEKGFNKDCLYCYTTKDNIQISSGDENDMETYNHNLWDNFSAPTQSLLQKWLREEHNLHIEIQLEALKQVVEAPKYNWIIFGAFYTMEKSLYFGNKKDAGKLYNNYEEALEEALLNSLKLIP